MPRNATRVETQDLRIPWVTLIKVGVAIFAGWALLRLWAPIQMLLFAALIAVALSPVVTVLEKRHVSRGASVGLLAAAVIVLGSAFAFFVLPPLMEQGATLWKNLPALRASISRSLDKGGLSARIVLPLLDLPHSPEVDAWLARPLTWGPPALEAAAAAVVVVVLSLYLLLDGRKVVAWLLAYAPRAHRRKMGDMVPELFAVVQAYATGQMITCALFGTFVFGVLAATGVPGALPLALIAAICDVIPVAGIVIATSLATLSALTVGPSTALLVFGLFVVYHLFEAYLLIPRLYGRQMRLSTLTVLFAILAGGTLGGIPGAILALPLVAAYPVIEKHWLDEWLHPDVVADHAALRETEGVGRHRKLVTAVLEGRPADGPR